MEHSDNELLVPELVNSAIGRDLMGFCWVGDKHTIGDIGARWHFIPNHSEGSVDKISMIHFTEGGPNLPNCRGSKYDSIWFDEYQDYLESKILKVGFDVESIIDGN